MSRICALINPHSGSVPENSGEALESFLSELGHKVEITMLGEGDFVGPIKDVIKSAPDILIVWSGDGTVACAFENAGPHGPPILPLPGGTMNLFHKQIHGGACEWQDCLRKCLEDGVEIDVPAGKAGDAMFFVAAMAGNLTDLTGPREAIRKGHLMEALETLSGSDVLDLRTTMTFEVENEDGKEAKGYATAVSIFVGTQEEGALEFAYIDPDNPMELAASGFGALFNDWREASGVSHSMIKSAVLTHERGSELRTTLDGEPARLKSGTKFSRIAKAGRAISANL
ncbi:diacylglycerol/lipid kinase family protein [Henriciella marina]|uniref:diacylglycerol/lipid kinase family protein n=1 Tax=Henriciella marina TaxID=453851 RepID=UPI0003796356|nr:diacylglycerol kinase family protein [Henriciella marina]